MKKTIKTSAFCTSLTVLITLFASCEKQEIKTEKPEIKLNSDLNSAATPNTSINGDFVRYWSSDESGCDITGTSCWWPPIVVKPKPSSYNTLVNSVGNPVAVGDFFSIGNYAELFPFLDDSSHEDKLNKLKSGNYDIIHVINANAEFFLVGQSGFTKENHEFVLTLQEGNE
jgi:hypothetical protein